MTLVPMNTEQLRRVAMKNAQQKLEEQKNWTPEDGVFNLPKVKSIKISKK